MFFLLTIVFTILIMISLTLAFINICSWECYKDCWIEIPLFTLVAYIIVFGISGLIGTVLTEVIPETRVETHIETVENPRIMLSENSIILQAKLPSEEEETSNLILKGSRSTIPNAQLVNNCVITNSGVTQVEIVKEIGKVKIGDKELFSDTMRTQVFVRIPYKTMEAF